MSVLRVTFDTNTFDGLIAPHSQNGKQQIYECLQSALKNGQIKGFFSDTVVTLEGIQGATRSDVMGSSKVTTTISHAGNTTNINMDHNLEKRPPLDSRTSHRIQELLSLGLKALGGTRAAFPRIEDPDHTIYYNDETPEELSVRIEKYGVAVTEIEERGVGAKVAENLANTFDARTAVNCPWFRKLGLAPNEAEKRLVREAISEWSDGDSIGAHIAYGNDVFCTEDKAKNARHGLSIFNQENRAWLHSRFGTEIKTPEELAYQLELPPLLHENISL